MTACRVRRGVGLFGAMLMMGATLTACVDAPGEPDEWPAVLSGGWTAATTGPAPQVSECTWGAGSAHPDPVCTPGLVYEELGATDVSAVCLALGEPAPQVPVNAAEKVLLAYGVDDPDSVDLDYLVPPALGGANDFRNIWPVPRGERIAERKVQTDRLVGSAVCAQEAGIQAAQFAFAWDWTSAPESLGIDAD